MSTILVDKTIGAFEARRNFGNILREVEVKGDSFIVERHGEAVAAVVPIHVYEQWKQRREAFFERMRIAAETANLSEEEAVALANEAIAAVRAERKK